jgi:hypothetical protein
METARDLAKEFARPVNNDVSGDLPIELTRNEAEGPFLFNSDVHIDGSSIRRRGSLNHRCQGDGAPRRHSLATIGCTSGGAC